jgi:GntR family transcriptional regulator/MocR family aminotransferase
MRMLYADRRRALAAALEAAFGSSASVEMAAGGMHLLLRLAGSHDDSALVKRAAMAGLAPTALSAHTMAHDCGQGLLLSFTNIPVEAAPAMVARLRGLTAAPPACDLG